MFYEISVSKAEKQTSLWKQTKTSNSLSGNCILLALLLKKGIILWTQDQKGEKNVDKDIIVVNW